MKFPSQEWIDEYSKKLNESQDYRDAGKNWEGDMLFVIERDEALPQDAFVYLDLFHGQCRKALYAEGSKENLPVPAFAYKGIYSNWKKMLQGEIDPLKGVLMGKFKLDGSVLKILRETKAAKAMIDVAASIETKFY